MIITIDGTASSGKTSVARAFATRLDFPLLGTGLIYRAITFKALKNVISFSDISGLQKMLDETEIESKFTKGKLTIYLDKIPMTNDELHEQSISENVAHYASIPFVREFVRKIQRKQAEIHKNIIVEGRDIGSVVFPNADYKFFIDADLETRAKRRFEDLVKNGENVKFEDVKKELANRDHEDSHREISPLIITSDSIYIDSSQRSIAEVVEEMAKKIK